LTIESKIEERGRERERGREGNGEVDCYIGCFIFGIFGTTLLLTISFLILSNVMIGLLSVVRSLLVSLKL